MTVSLSVAIMAHRKRERMVDDLLARLDRPVDVVWDQINDRHHTGARAMEAYDSTCTHHLVLQDDVMPCRDLLAGVERALEFVPAGRPISLYTGRVRPFVKEINRVVSQAGRFGASWITMAGIYWGPGIVVPTADIDEMLDWYRGEEGETVANYDKRVSTWFEARERKTWYTHPSLIEHRGVISLAGHPGAERIAHRFIGGDASALEVDWTGTVLDLENTKAMDEARQAAARAARAPKPKPRKPKVSMR